MTIPVPTVRDAFREAYGTAPSGVAAAPGRVNLIGEHTDYNDGFVLPLTLDRGVAVAWSRRTDGRLRARSLELPGEVDVALEGLRPGVPGGWGAYVAGTAWALREAGHAVEGADLFVASDLPVGAGLSSSAALELAVTRALAGAWDLPWDPLAMAEAARRAENAYVGVACGVMDQMAAALGQAGAALLLDCRTLEVEPVALPAGVAALVLDTGVRRALSAGLYNSRVEACRAAAARIARDHPDVRALRDVSPELLAEYEGRMDAEAYRRAAHVVREIRRPAAFAAALRAGELEEAGRLMAESHRSLRDLFEVSGPELDAMVEAATAQTGCYGARLTGAGLGGCAVALVRRDASDDVARATLAAYRARVDLPASSVEGRPRVSSSEGRLPPSSFEARGAEGARLLD